MHFRPACPQDAPQIAAIYNHYVQSTAITFAYAAPTAREFAEKILRLGATHPFLVCEERGEVAGFAYAAPYREKEAFLWDVELTIYLAPEKGGGGLGTALMGRLLACVKDQGFQTAYSCVTLPGEASLRLHRRFGFDTLGVHPRAGYKHGRWHDVIWLALPLGDFSPTPVHPRPFAAYTQQMLEQLWASQGVSHPRQR